MSQHQFLSDSQRRIQLFRLLGWEPGTLFTQSIRGLMLWHYGMGLSGKSPYTIPPRKIAQWLIDYAPWTKEAVPHIRALRSEYDV